MRLGPISVELPIRVERLLSIQGHDADIPVEMLASELVTYLEERPSGDDPYCLANYAAALVRSGRPREALEVCDRIRRLPMPRGIGFALLALQRECASAIADEGSREPVS